MAEACRFSPSKGPHMTSMFQVYDLTREVAEFIDGRVPDLGVPVSILKSYLIEFLAQDGGTELVSAFVSPQEGKTVGTALVEHRHHRWTKTLGESDTLLPWLLERGVDLNRPDAHGNTAALQAFLFDAKSLPGYSLAEVMKDVMQTPMAFERALKGGGMSALAVSPSGKSLLQCRGQTPNAREKGLPVLRECIEEELRGIEDGRCRWETMEDMQAGGVSPAMEKWWKQVRLQHFHAFLDYILEGSLAPSAPKPRL